MEIQPPLFLNLLTSIDGSTEWVVGVLLETIPTPELLAVTPHTEMCPTYPIECMLNSISQVPLAMPFHRQILEGDLEVRVIS
jgi:hypothetical protein